MAEKNNVGQSFLNNLRTYVRCLLHYTTQILTHPPPIHPLFRDHPYKRPFIGGKAGGLLEEGSLYIHNLLVSYNKGLHNQ
jgi:hypothetical protein